MLFKMLSVYHTNDILVHNCFCNKGLTMRETYNYEPQLDFKPSFNIWQQNFTEEPYKSAVNQLIKNSFLTIKEYRPIFDCTVTSGQYQSDDEMLDFYKVSPNGKEHEALSVIVYYHGGGFICPLDKMMMNNSCYYSSILDCHVLLPQYRLAPDHSAKEMLSDCYNFLLFARENQKELSLNMDKFIIFGDSAGGALAAGTALLSKSLSGPKALCQMLIYPVTDNRLDCYESMKLEYAEWNKQASVYMWQYALTKGSEYLNYIAPMYNEDLSDLPPAYIEVQEYDTLRDQGIAYAEKLKAADVPVTLNQIKGTFHGFDNNINNQFVIRALQNRCNVMKTFF